jgi:hypothetical protein
MFGWFYGLAFNGSMQREGVFADTSVVAELCERMALESGGLRPGPLAAAGCGTIA